MLIKTVINAKELYKLYTNSAKNTNKGIVDFTTYKKILETYSQVLIETLIQEGRVTFCGTILKIIIARAKGKATDHKMSSLYKTEVFNFNEHSFGWIASIIWDDFGLKKKKNYLFKKSAQLGKGLSKKIISDPKHILTYQLKTKRHD